MQMSPDELCIPQWSEPDALVREPRSEHARTRQQQRAARDQAVDATLRWGRLIRQPQNRSAYFLGANEVRQAARAGESIERYLGTIVVQAADSTLVTVIRSSSCRKLRRMAR